MLELEANQTDSQFLKDIYNLSKGFIEIKLTGTFDEAISYANSIWNRIQKFDSCYLSDIYLVNNILFLFPIETSVYISNYAIKQIL